MQPPEVKKGNVLQRASLQPMSKVQLHMHSLLNLSNPANTSGSLQSLNGTTPVNQVMLLMTGLQRQALSTLQGARLQALAATMTVLLGILLLTAFFMVLRPSYADFDPEGDQTWSESHPSPVNKLPRHSHTAAAT